VENPKPEYQSSKEELDRLTDPNSNDETFGNRAIYDDTKKGKQPIKPIVVHKHAKDREERALRMKMAADQRLESFRLHSPRLACYYHTITN